jgi:hypothetical protein
LREADQRHQHRGENGGGDCAEIHRTTSLIKTRPAFRKARMRMSVTALALMQGAKQRLELV